MTKTLRINGVDYKIKFRYNCFCDTDLLDRVEDMARLFQAAGAENDKDVAATGHLKKLFCIVRELLFFGFEKYNPVESVQEIGDILDDYIDEETDEDRGLLNLFSELADLLFESGFLSDVMHAGETGMENGAKAPTDHQKPKKSHTANT